MERKNEEEKVFVATKNLGQDWASSFDGFSLEFFVTYWDFMKFSIVAIVKEFHDENILDKSLETPSKH